MRLLPAWAMAEGLDVAASHTTHNAATPERMFTTHPLVGFAGPGPDGQCMMDLSKPRSAAAGPA
jgi:hypothetical protein